MHTVVNKEKNDLLDEAIYLEHFVLNIENSIFEVYSCYLSYLCVTSLYIYCGVEDKKILEANLFNYSNVFKHLCKTFSKFKKLEKFFIYLRNSQELDGFAIEETVELSLNYEKNKPFVSKEELERYAEKSLTHDSRRVPIDFEYDYNEDFTDLKREIEDIIENLRGDNTDCEHIKLKFEKCREKVDSFQIEEYHKMLVTHAENLSKMNEMLMNDYYPKYIMQSRKTFEYKHSTNDIKECAVCLEDFENGKSVTKLKCGHIFCAKCIEDWLEENVSCPCCRKFTK